MTGAEKNPTPPADTSKAGTDGGNDGKGAEDKNAQKTFTQEELDKVLQDRLAKQDAKFDKKLDIKIKETQKEADRLNKLDTEEKEKELQTKAQKALTDKERTLTLRENKLEGIKKLDEMGIPIKFVDFILNSDLETMDSNIEKLNSEWTTAIEEGVKTALAGKTPKDPVGGDSGVPKVLGTKSF